MLSVHSYWLLIFPGAPCNNLSITKSIYYSLTYSTVYGGYVSIVRLILSSGSSVCCLYLNNGQIPVIAVMLILVFQIILFEIYVRHFLHSKLYFVVLETFLRLVCYSGLLPEPFQYLSYGLDKSFFGISNCNHVGNHFIL